MFLFKLALKNLWRNPRRALLSVVAIIAGLYVLLLGDGFVSGTSENIVRAQIDTITGHVAIRPADYPTEAMQYPVDEMFELDDADTKWLDGNTHSWTKRVYFAPEVINGVDGIKARGIGFVPEKDLTVFTRDNWGFEEGSKWPVTAEDGVALSPTLAKLLDVKTGDYLTLKVRSHPGAINAIRVKVSTVFHSNTPYLDHSTVFVPWPLAKQLLLIDEETSHVTARLANRNNVDSVGKQMVEQIEGTEFVTWETETEGVLAIQNIRKRMLNIISGVLLLVSAFSIANTILMAAYERVREIGTLRAMGMTRSDVIQLFVMEGAVMGLVGSAIGTAAGAAHVYQLATTGIDLSPMVEDIGTETYANIPMSMMIYLAFSPSMVAIAFVLGVLIATLGSIYPAYVASNMTPADAVRA